MLLLVCLDFSKVKGKYFAFSPKFSIIQILINYENLICQSICPYHVLGKFRCLILKEKSKCNISDFIWWIAFGFSLQVDEDVQRHDELLEVIKSAPSEINEVVARRRKDFTKEFFVHVHTVAESYHDNPSEQNGET